MPKKKKQDPVVVDFEEHITKAQGLILVLLQGEDQQSATFETIKSHRWFARLGSCPEQQAEIVQTALSRLVWAQEVEKVGELFRLAIK